MASFGRMAAARTLILGDTELARIGLGTNRLRKTPENVQFVGRAVAAGIGMVDTAHSYTDGESEATIGEALSPRPGPAWSSRRRAASGQRPRRGIERADRREPAPPADRHDRPLLPAPRRPRDSARGEPRHHRRVSRSRADPACRALGGRHRAARAGVGSSRSRRSRTATTWRSAARGGGRPLRRAGDRVRCPSFRCAADGARRSAEIAGAPARPLRSRSRGS